MGDLLKSILGGGGDGQSAPVVSVPAHQMSDDELLDWRICDLGVRIQGTPLERRISRIYRELEQREIHFRPHFWLSDDWFSPDGVPGIAILCLRCPLRDFDGLSPVSPSAVAGSVWQVVATLPRVLPAAAVQ